MKVVGKRAFESTYVELFLFILCVYLGPPEPFGFSVLSTSQIPDIIITLIVNPVYPLTSTYAI